MREVHSDIDKEILNKQLPHWESVLSNNPDMFGLEPSEAARKALDAFKKEGARKILELGGGQGRDSLFFVREGFEVTVLDYAQSGLDAIKKKADALGLPNLVATIRHDVREPLPFEDGIFDGCFSHMLFCMAL
ncbi:MAG: class I SAM-dependent methyltransferase, partial [Candidatus Tectomicrobia bacterium]|nr:class I SAM-dependent methyltransferase [Candidatus Tectomicrobia bacterium]